MKLEYLTQASNDQIRDIQALMGALFLPYGIFVILLTIEAFTEVKMVTMKMNPSKQSNIKHSRN